MCEDHDDDFDNEEDYWDDDNEGTEESNKCPFAATATVDLVKLYLMDEEDGYGLTEVQAEDMMAKHKDELDKGIKLMSFASYVGDQIMADEDTGK